MSFQF